MADQPVFHNRKSAAEHVKNKYGQTVTVGSLAKLACKGGGLVVPEDRR